MTPTALALHRARCRDPYCEACPTAAEARKAELDEPLSLDEESALDTWVERLWGL